MTTPQRGFEFAEFATRCTKAQLAMAADDIDAIFAVLHSVGYVIYMINEVTCGGRPDCVNFLAFPSAPSIELWNEVQPKGEYFKAMIGGNLIPLE